MTFIKYDVEERLNSFKEHEISFEEIGILHVFEMEYAASGEIPLSREKIFEIARKYKSYLTPHALENVFRKFFDKVDDGFVPSSYCIERIETEEGKGEE